MGTREERTEKISRRRIQAQAAHRVMVGEDLVYRGERRGGESGGTGQKEKESSSNVKMTPFC
jgi:hypothetical protein